MGTIGLKHKWPIFSFGNESKISFCTSITNLITSLSHHPQKRFDGTGYNP
jgi:hypothetical protein